MFFPIVFVHFKLGHRAPTHRYSGIMDRFWIPRYQRVPGWQWLTLPDQPIGAGPRHPIGMFIDVIGTQHNAFWHELVSNIILTTLAGGIIKQPTGHTGQIYAP